MRRTIESKIESLDDCEVTVQGERESAGQVYYEIGVKADNPKSVAETLNAVVADSKWIITVYEDGGPPYWYDYEADEEHLSDLRIKKNLYNQHNI